MKRLPKKWLVLFLIWLMMIVAYFDRINLASAGTSIMASLHLSKLQLGWVLAAFTLGYCLMQAPGGHLADRFGSKRLLIVSIFLWSAFTALTGLATSLVMMLATRVVFGVGEGLENGAQFKLIGDHFSAKERSLANSLFLSALAIGPAIGTPLATWMIVAHGWRETFYVFGALGVVVGGMLIWLLPARSGITPAEAEPVSRGSLLTAFRRPATLLCAFGYFLFNIAFWGFLSWVPTYLREDRHVPLAKTGLVGALPYVAGLIGMLIAGYLGSTKLVKSRPMLVAFCYVAAGCGLTMAMTAPTLPLNVTGLCLAGAFLYAGFGPHWAIAVDLAPSQLRGAFTGSVNFCGQVGAFSSQIIIGKLADDMKSFTGALVFMIGALLLGAVAMAVLQFVPHGEPKPGPEI